MEKTLPSIPAKCYFTISEVSSLCGVKPHVLRYWEQEFACLRPMKRRGNRRYYQRHEVSMIRKIRELLYDQGFTIVGARNKLQELVQNKSKKRLEIEPNLQPLQCTLQPDGLGNSEDLEHRRAENVEQVVEFNERIVQRWALIRCELLEIRDLLSPNS